MESNEKEFGVVALAKLWVWRHAARRPELLGPSSDPATLRRISRRSLAVPIACAAAIALSLVSVFLAPLAFILIPLIARARPRPAPRGVDRGSVRRSLRASRPATSL